MKKKEDWTNEDFMNDLMNISPYGILCQAFIIQAIEHYCDKMIADKERILAEDKENQDNGKISIVSHEAWIGIAEDIKTRIVDMYHNKLKR